MRFENTVHAKKGHAVWSHEHREKKSKPSRSLHGRSKSAESPYSPIFETADFRNVSRHWDMTMSTSGSFSPTSAELTLVSQILSTADPQKLGILTSDVAVRILGGTKLPPVTLGEIWNIADEENNGWLPRKGLAIAVRLIGWSQKGEKVSQALVSKRKTIFS